MNCRCFLTLLFVALSLSAWADRVPESAAREVARQVLSGFSPLRAAVSPVLAYQAPATLRSGDGADYYIYAPDQGDGFVIVAGDDIAYPVLGYSKSDPFRADRMPVQMSGWLANYQEEMNHARGTTAPKSVSAQWASVLRGELHLETGRVLETPDWGQGEPFNRLTPQIGGEQTVVGCVAVAMGMVMGYHKYPERAVNPPATNNFWIAGTPTTEHIDYGEPYDWANMLHTYNAGYNDRQAMAVSRLLYHCGANVGMNYGIGASAASTKDIPKLMRDLFGYSPAIHWGEKALMTWDAWKALIRSDIDDGLPICYAGHNEELGHAFVCDGYYEDYFHFNWGWGSYGNGYYLLSALTPEPDDFTSQQTAVFHIKPTPTGVDPTPVFTVTGTVFSVDGNTVKGQCQVLHTGLDDTFYHIGLGVIDVDKNIIQYPKTNESSSANFSPSLSYSRTVTLTLNFPLSGNEMVVVLGSYDGQQWDILPTAPLAPIGLGPDGPVFPPDDEPNDPDKPVNMKVHHNTFTESNYMLVCSHDDDEQNTYNVGSIRYSLNQPKDITFTFTISEYDQWKGKLSIFAGDKFFWGDKGELMVVDDDGTFVISKSALMPINGSYYIQELKLLSTQRGELKFSVTATAEGFDIPVYSQSDMSVRFVEQTDTRWGASPIVGKTGEKMILKPVLSQLDPFFQHENIHFEVGFSGFAQDEFTLYRSDGKPLSTRAFDNNPNAGFTPTPVMLFEQGVQRYDLVFIPKVPRTLGDNAYIYTVPYHNGKRIPGNTFVSRLVIEKGIAANEGVDSGSASVYVRPDAVIVRLVQDSDVVVCTLDGKWVRSSRLSAGDHRISLQKGFYLVKVDGQTFKIVI